MMITQYTTTLTPRETVLFQSEFGETLFGSQIGKKVIIRKNGRVIEGTLLAVRNRRAPDHPAEFVIDLKNATITRDA